MIPFNRASFEGHELGYLHEAISRGHISGNGSFTKRAEAHLESRTSSERTLLATSCTHALEMAALLLRLQPGDEVIVPAFTFITSASAFMLHGATPVFVDVDPATLNIDPSAVAAAITPRTRAVVVVHYGGVAADVVELVAVCAAHGVVLVEDNAHGLFATLDGRLLGSFGALAAQSFHETKNITCGEGGALVINDARFTERAEILREKGTDRGRFLRGQVDKYTWVDTGSSFVMSDLLAALLLGQLERFDQIHLRRHHIYDRYVTELAEWARQHDVLLPTVPQGRKHPAHVMHLRFGSGPLRDAFIEHLARRDVLAVFHYQPLHLSTVGRRLGGRDGQFPVTERAADTLVRLPLYESLTGADQDQVIDAVQSFTRVEV